MNFTALIFDTGSVFRKSKVKNTNKIFLKLLYFFIFTFLTSSFLYHKMERGGEKLMSIFCCENKPSCVTLAVIASAILGVVAALLQITAVITVTPAFLWVALGTAIVYLVVLLATSRCCRASGCCRCGNAALTAILTGILGTALTSVILLAITFVATSIIGAVLVGLLILFLSLIVSATACLVSRCCGQQNDR